MQGKADTIRFVVFALHDLLTLATTIQIDINPRCKKYNSWRINVEWIIEPFKGIGPIKFGMTSEEVTSIIEEIFPNTISGKCQLHKYETLSDTFDQGLQGFHAHYRKDSGCHDIEIYYPQSIIRPIFMGNDLVKMPYGKMLNWFQELDTDLGTDYCSFTSPRFHLSVCCYDEDELDGESPLESGPSYIGIFDLMSQTYSLPSTSVASFLK
jgi:hypothetical protein